MIGPIFTKEIWKKNDNKLLKLGKQIEEESTAAAAAKSLQSCPTLCDPMDCSLPGFSVHGILQARTLEWVTISFSINASYHLEIQIFKIGLLALFTI